MTDEQLNQKFDRISNHIEALTESLDRLEQMQIADRQRFDEAQSRADARIARLERVVQSLATLARRERNDLRAKINALTNAQISTEDDLKKLTTLQERVGEEMQKLAASQQRTDEEMQKLAASQQRTDEEMQKLAASQQRTDEEMQKLAASQQRTGEEMQKLAVSQQRTDEEMQKLAVSQQRTGEEMQKLAASQQRLEEAQTDFQRQVGQAMADMAKAVKTAHERIDLVERDGNV